MDTTAILWSGGKDSALALYRARQSGLNVRYAYVWYFRDFKFPPDRELMRAQAEAVGLEPIFIDTDMRTTYNTIKQLAAHHSLTHLVFGEGHIIADIRLFRDLCRKLSITAVIPNFQYTADQNMNELLDTGFKFYITRANCDIDTAHLGIYTREIYDQFMAEYGSAYVDPYGPASACQTFVVDGPIFTHPIDINIERRQYGDVTLKQD